MGCGKRKKSSFLILLSFHDVLMCNWEQASSLAGCLERKGPGLSWGQIAVANDVGCFVWILMKRNERIVMPVLSDICLIMREMTRNERIYLYLRDEER